MATKGCDSSWDFNYTSRMVALVSGGYKFIGRYLNHCVDVRNGLTQAEVERISTSGTYIFSLYEADDGDDIDHFTRANGIADAEDAVALARNIGMPEGIYPIYFCIDTEVWKSQMNTHIYPYVQGILSVLNNTGYKLGIYGPIPVCKAIRGTYSALERYMMICDNDWGERKDWSASELQFDDWNIRQYKWNQPLSGASPVVVDECEAPSIGTAGCWIL